MQYSLCNILTKPPDLGSRSINDASGQRRCACCFIPPSPASAPTSGSWLRSNDGRPQQTQQPLTVYDHNLLHFIPDWSAVEPPRLPRISRFHSSIQPPFLHMVLFFCILSGNPRRSGVDFCLVEAGFNGHASGGAVTVYCSRSCVDNIPVFPVAFPFHLSASFCFLFLLYFC